MSESSSLSRGAFFVYPRDAYPDKPQRIPFRFNPEGLSRSLSIEPPQNGGGTEGARPSGGAGQKNADDASGTLKETFTVQIRLDFADLVEAKVGGDDALGVLPDVAALEELVYPAESATEANSDGKEASKQRTPRPTVLFIWGSHRVFPVRITGLTINESFYNALLNPTRAEVEVQLEVLSEADARNNLAVADALTYTGRIRRQMARLYLNRTGALMPEMPPIRGPR